MSNTERKRVLNYRNGDGLAPNPDNIDYGEIAIGYKKDNEAIYIKNTTNEIVDFTPISIVSLTYTELKELRDNSKLKPSQYYRITDFVTTVANDPEAKSAGYRFDIIVMASKENKLQEECYAIQHEGETYFDNCNLAAWKIWYCLDNDTTKYAWADTANGKGVIYRMIDEWQNDCPYDFKNVQFKRYYTNGLQNGDDVIAKGYFAIDNNINIFPEGAVDTSNPLYCYTFTRLNGIESGYGVGGVTQDNVLDESIQTLESSSILSNRCQNNVLGTMKSDMTVNEMKYMPHILTNNVFLSVLVNLGDSERFYTPSFDNKIGINCFNNTFGNNIYGLTFGDGCHDNIIGDGCAYNTFGNGCYSNSFGSDCLSNSFGNNCNYNSFGNGCSNNTFGNGCNDNSFGNYCNGNSFGNDCYSNSFGDNCDNNTFRNGCYGNSFGNYFQYNALGNDIVYIEIPTEKIYHTQILNGTKGTRANKLTIAFTPEAAYSQFAGTAPDGTLMVWVPTSNTIEPVQGNKQYNDY